MASDDRLSVNRQPARSIQKGRDQIALLVVVASFLTVFLLVTTLVALAKFNASEAASNVAEKAFNATLPVIAGWVGTVLAFYFSAASQERTNELLDKAIQQGSGRTIDGTPVAAKMLLLTNIRGLRDLNTENPASIPLAALQDDFKIKVNDRTISRLMFLDKGAFKYVLHVGTLNKFLIDVPTSERTPSPSFADLLKNPDIVTEISALVVFVPVSATLAEAKAALDKVIGAQDIIVTATGSPTEPVLGWLTNVDLTKALTAS